MPRELESCVAKVKAKRKVKNPWAVCRASLGTDAEILARRKRAGWPPTKPQRYA